MDILEMASDEVKKHAFSYFKDKKINNLKEVEPGRFTATCDSRDRLQMYEVFLDTLTPNKSTCTCDDAYGKVTLCRHMLATYYTLYPGEARFVDEDWNFKKLQEELLFKNYALMVHDYVNHLSKEELREQLFKYIIEENEREGFIG